MKHYLWDEVPAERLSATISRKMITGERMMMTRIFLKKGAVVPRHQHENEQIAYVLSGALEFEIDGKTLHLGAGAVLVIPSNIPHSAKALEDTDNLDVFTPPRADWLSGDDAYLRG